MAVHHLFRSPLYDLHGRGTYFHRDIRDDNISIAQVQAVAVSKESKGRKVYVENEKQDGSGIHLGQKEVEYTDWMPNAVVIDAGVADHLGSMHASWKFTRGALRKSASSAKKTVRELEDRALMAKMNGTRWINEIFRTMLFMRLRPLVTVEEGKMFEINR